MEIMLIGNKNDVNVTIRLQDQNWKWTMKVQENGKFWKSIDDHRRNETIFNELSKKNNSGPLKVWSLE